MINLILSILSGALSIYTLICFVYIFMSWFPGARYTKFGNFIASICEPYLGLFSRFRFLRIGNIDFSPIISIGLLSIVSSILGRIQATGRIWFGSILGDIVYMIWNIVSVFLVIFTILILVRWIVLLVNKGQTDYNSGWARIDQMINRFTRKVSGTFIKKNHNYQTSLLVSWITLLVIYIAAKFLISFLVGACYSIPF